MFSWLYQVSFFFQFFFKLSCRNWVQHLHWIYEFIYIDCKDYVFHQLKTFICFMDKKHFFGQFLFWNLLESCHVPDFQGQKKGIYWYLCTKLIENEVCFVELQGRLHVYSDMTWKCSIASRLIDCHCPWTKFRRN